MTQMVTQKAVQFFSGSEEKIAIISFIQWLSQLRKSQYVLVTINSGKGTTFQNLNQKEALIFG